VIVVLVGVVQWQDKSIMQLEHKEEIWKIEDARLLSEYEENMKKFNQVKKEVEVRHTEKVIYIEGRVDANTSCEDVMGEFDKYSF
jgi:pyruvate/2-oxoacid:ferredoxin oxidoreductase alpha subunit